jgi:hypothetical protein
MKTLLLGLFLIPMVLVTGCTLLVPQESRYLQSAQDRATQEEVQQRLGPPWRTSATPSGEAVWVYEVREEEPGSRWTSLGLWCEEYVLTFDAGGVLRRWTHRSFFHGGELMPPHCDSGVQKPAV